MTPAKPLGNGWSDRAKLIVWITERIGITGVITFAILYGLYGLGAGLIKEVGVPLVHAHQLFLEKQTTAMDKITLSQERQEKFWIAVQETHARQVELLMQNQKLIDQGNQQSVLNTKLLETVAGNGNKTKGKP